MLCLPKDRGCVCVCACVGSLTQTWLLLCLTLVALSSVPFADSLVNVAPGSRVDPATSTLARRLQVVCGVVAPALAVAWAYVGRAVTAGCRPVLARLGAPLPERLRG